MKKRIVAMMLALCTMFIFSIPAFAETTVPETTPLEGEIQLYASIGQWGKVTANGVRLRKGPIGDTAILGHLQNGDKVQLKGTGAISQGYYYVYSERHGLNGYVSTSYVKF